jgi:hypothetical protein
MIFLPHRTTTTFSYHRIFINRLRKRYDRILSKSDPLSYRGLLGMVVEAQNTYTHRRTLIF